jgi:predicted nuclease of predicted toxin-antitoxin system
MTRVLLDQGLAPRTAALLRATGWNAVHVIEISLDRADDRDILKAAREGNRVCITLDRDFHRHLALAPILFT